VDIPPPIEILTILPPGTNLGNLTRSYRIAWRGAAPGTLVSIRVTVWTYQRRVQLSHEYITAAEAGERYVGGGLDTFASGEAEVVVRYLPAEEYLQLFQALGLTLGGRHLWSYEWRFTDIFM
jgi:hypothetical protein